MLPREAVWVMGCGWSAGRGPGSFGASDGRALGSPICARSPEADGAGDAFSPAGGKPCADETVSSAVGISVLVGGARVTVWASVLCRLLARRQLYRRRCGRRLLVGRRQGGWRNPLEVRRDYAWLKVQ
jgi:hypothetical protein